MKIEKKRKVLMVISLLNYGGASKMFLHLAKFLADNAYEVTIYTYSNKEKINIQHPKIKLVPSICKSTCKIFRRITPIYNIRKTIKKEEPDVIITFLTNSNFYTILARLGLKIPLIISERSDPYYENNVILSIMRLFYIFSDRIIFQTNEARAYFNKCIRKKGRVIPNPVTLNEKINLVEREGKYKISFVGRFDIKQKRQDIMVYAFKKVLKTRNDVDLYFYGDGPDMKTIKDIVKKEKIEDNVFFMGKVNDVLREIRDSTIFILTSDYEGIPNSLMEAMSIGLPVISTDCSPGGAKLLIKHMHNGLLIPRNDKKSLYDSIIYLLENQNFRKTIGKNALKINSIFENNKVMNMWLEEINYLNKQEINSCGMEG